MSNNTYHCSNCRERISGDNLKKISIGTNRNVVFCGQCNCYVALEEPVLKKPEKK